MPDYQYFDEWKYGRFGLPLGEAKSKYPILYELCVAACERHDFWFHICISEDGGIILHDETIISVPFYPDTKNFDNFLKELVQVDDILGEDY